MGDMARSDSRLRGLAMGHDPSRTALLAASSHGLELCGEELKRLT